MPITPFFQHGSPDEQRLVQQLIDEHLGMFGIEIYYIPRKLITTDDILGEVQSSKFNDNFIMAMDLLVNGIEKRVLPNQEFQSFYIKKHSSIEVMDWKFYIKPVQKNSK